MSSESMSKPRVLTGDAAMHRQPGSTEKSRAILSKLQNASGKVAEIIG